MRRGRLVDALAAIGKLQNPSIVLLKDFHRWMDDPLTVRALRELGHALKSTFTTVVIVAPALKIPEELEKELSVIDVPLPGEDDLRTLLNDIVAVVRPQQARGGRARRRPDRRADHRRAGPHAVRGRERVREGDRARQPARRRRRRSSCSRRSARSSARAACSSTTAPTRTSTRSAASRTLKKWLDRRGDGVRRGGADVRAARAEGRAAARRAGLRQEPRPRKAIADRVARCRCCASTSARIFGRLHRRVGGEPARARIRTAEAIAPVRAVDRRDREGARRRERQRATAASRARVFGTLLTWMQEKTRRCSWSRPRTDIEALPPELLRKGRFDEIFFVDLPTRARARRDLPHPPRASAGAIPRGSTSPRSRGARRRVLRRRDRAGGGLGALRRVRRRRASSSRTTWRGASARRGRCDHDVGGGLEAERVGETRTRPAA